MYTSMLSPPGYAPPACASMLPPTHVWPQMKVKVEEEPVQPAEYEFAPIIVTRESLCQDAGITVEGTLITDVEPGSVGCMRGAVKGMTITAVDGKEATQDVVTRALDNCVSFTLSVSCSCLLRLRGEVDTWDARKSSGWITPSLPVYVGSETWGSKVVYFGNVRCSASALGGTVSLAPGQKVEFAVRVSGTYLVACDITGPRGGALKEHNVASEGPSFTRELSLETADQEVCAQFAKGVCPYVSACPNGLHPEPTKKLQKKKVKKNKKHITKTVFNCGWDVVTLSAEGVSKDLMYSKNQGAQRHITKVVYSAVTGDLLLTCQGECEEVVEQALPDDAASILSDIQALCMGSSVPCTVPPSVTESSHCLKKLFTEVSDKKLGILREAYEGACGGEETWGVLRAWEVHSDVHRITFGNTEQQLVKKNRKAPAITDTYCGLPEGCVLEDAMNGLQKTTLQHTNPNRASDDCCGGSFMFRCKTLLGKDGKDFTTTPAGYEVAEGYAVPCFLLQFSYAESKLAETLTMFSREVQEELVPLTKLGESQRGGTTACKGRTESAMMAQTTTRMWLGWLDPEFEQSDDSIAADIVAHLVGHEVVLVKVERNAARIGAHVELRDPVTQCQLAEINTRLYKGQHVISADDAQPVNPWTSMRPCPRQLGPAKYCRGWNIKGHTDWTESCSFSHTNDALTHACVRYTAPLQDTQLFSELVFEVEGRQLGHVVHIEVVHNDLLAGIYGTRKNFLAKKHQAGNIVERELWYGTNPHTLSQVCSSGVQPPSDTVASPDCSVSGGRGLHASDCSNNCRYCIEPHTYTGCHKYGLGVRMTETPAGAHQDVVPDQRTGVHSLVKCKVNLGRPYLIDKKLVEQDSMHGVVRCVDPEGRVDACSEEWCTATGHDAYEVRCAAASEYVIFQPYQIMPLYIVHYKLGAAPSVPQPVHIPQQHGVRLPVPPQPQWAAPRMPYPYPSPYPAY